MLGSKKFFFGGGMRVGKTSALIATLEGKIMLLEDENERLRAEVGLHPKSLAAIDSPEAKKALAECLDELDQ